MARTGRRPGNADTRQEILTVATAQFAELGYDGVSLRGVARAAGVDPALLHHYFSGKSGLFTEVMHLPFDPAVVLPDVLRGPLASLGPRLARFFLGLWESPRSGPQMVAWIRSSLATEDASRRLREFALGELLARVAALLPADDEPERRAALVASQLIGVAVGRYLVQAAPLVEAGIDELVAVIGPTLQRYLTGALPTS